MHYIPETKYSYDQHEEVAELTKQDTMHNRQYVIVCQKGRPTRQPERYLPHPISSLYGTSKLECLCQITRSTHVYRDLTQISTTQDHGWRKRCKEDFSGDILVATVKITFNMTRKSRVRECLEGLENFANS